MSFGFEKALKHLKRGRKVARVEWHGKGMWLQLRKPDSQYTQAAMFICIRTERGYYMPWTVSHSDILSNDWAIVKL